MDDKEKNVTTVSNEDENFIRVLMSLSPEKKLIAQGILIGMNIQNNQEGVVQKGDARDGISSNRVKGKSRNIVKVSFIGGSKYK